METHAFYSPRSRQSIITGGWGVSSQGVVVRLCLALDAHTATEKRDSIYINTDSPVEGGWVPCACYVPDQGDALRRWAQCPITR